MKNLISILVFVLMSALVFCQEYDPIVKTGKRLSIGHHYMGQPNPTATNYELIGDDTTINELQYKKLMKSDMNHEFDPTYTLIGFIRETEDRKVYLRTLDNLEGLYYDYYVESGDTLNFYNPFLKSLYDDLLPSFGADTLIIVENVEFVNYEGVLRKTYNLRAFGENSLSPETFIEGVGSMSGYYNAGLYKFFALTGSSISLLCADDNGAIIYHNELYGNCFITNSNQIKSDELSIYPNPCDSKICITTQNNNKAHFSIIDITGKTVMTNYVTNSDIFDISELKTGVYTIRVWLNDKVYNKKIIIAR
ncbi:MAG: T9SS type A sorting domain-containing protein [Bacteroidales bacterium]|nr:T9SS type A sorting domain-containing protein [Bacteroidales bacterium]